MIAEVDLEAGLEEAWENVVRSPPSSLDSSRSC